MTRPTTAAPRIAVTKSHVNTSFLMDSALYSRWRKRLPKYGERSKVLNRLIEMFIDGDVDVVIPAKKL